MTRSPNKRKIKINEENILRLITTSEEEDDEDEDFTISPQKEVQNVEEGTVVDEIRSSKCSMIFTQCYLLVRNFQR